MPPPAFHPQSQTVTDSSNSNDSSDSEHEDNLQHDPSLQLRTVRTAASAVAESIREEARVRRKKTKRRLRLFRSRGKEKRKASDSLVDGGEHADEEEGKRNVVKTPRRNVYVNMAPTPEERDTGGEPLVRYVRNKVKTTSASLLEYFTTHETDTAVAIQSIQSSRSFLRTSMSSFGGTCLPISLTVSFINPIILMLVILYSVANLYFLALVVIQSSFCHP